MTDRQAEIAARADELRRARERALNDRTYVSLTYPQADALVADLAGLLAEIKQLTDRNAALEASAEALARSGGDE